MKKKLISIKNLLFQYSSNEEYKLIINQLEIFTGEIVAFIGLNGAGKTSLLSILAGIIKPKSGELNIYGTTFSLISLELLLDDSKNGYENIKRSFDMFDIQNDSESIKKAAKYTELTNEKLNQNIKKYSTGMKSRIAFAPLSLMNKEIYLIDEIMAVGDIKFSKKSYDTIVHKIKKRNACAVICTHSIETVLDIATKVVWLDNGKIIQIGKPKSVCAKFEDHIRSLTRKQIQRNSFFNNKSIFFKEILLNNDFLEITIDINKNLDGELIFKLNRTNGFIIFSKDINYKKQQNYYKISINLEDLTDQFLILSLINKDEILDEEMFELKRGIKLSSGNPLFYVKI